VTLLVLLACSFLLSNYSLFSVRSACAAQSTQPCLLHALHTVAITTRPHEMGSSGVPSHDVEAIHGRLDSG